MTSGGSYACLGDGMRFAWRNRVGMGFVSARESGLTRGAYGRSGVRQVPGRADGNMCM